MTVVNAIKFNDSSGAMVCDEQASWGEMDRKGNVADKIRIVIPESIQREFGLVAAYGGSGTTSIAEEIKTAIQDLLLDRYQKLMEKTNRKPDSFMTIQEIASAAFEKVAEIKRGHIDELLLHRYGFSGRDFIRGYYEKAGKRIDINHKEVSEKALDAMIWKNKSENTSLYVNRGILAGYDPQDGFRIFVLNLRTFLCEPVQAIFSSIGSGQDSSDFVFSHFAGMKTINQRRCDIDPVEGMIAILDATNNASQTNIGVGGYFNIVVFNGKKENHAERLWEISDNRARLASEIVAAYKNNLITQKTTYEIIGEMIFEQKSFDHADRKLRSRITDWPRLCRFLRGYKIE